MDAPNLPDENQAREAVLRGVGAYVVHLEGTIRRLEQEMEVARNRIEALQARDRQPG